MTIEVDPTQFDAGDEKVKFSDLFIFQKVLGNGSFGVVVSALQKPHLKECAVKVDIRINSNDQTHVVVDYHEKVSEK